MCRWLAYSGYAVRIEELLYKPQALADRPEPPLAARRRDDERRRLRHRLVRRRGDSGVFHSVEPAWNDRNLQDLAVHLESGLVFAHIRASSGSPIQQTNCHPFRHGRWLWMHNGLIRDFHRVKRDLVLRSIRRSTPRSRARPTRSASSSWPSRSGSRTTRRPRSSTQSASSSTWDAASVSTTRSR